MIDPIPTATYRIQLRDGVDFDTVRGQLEYLDTLGISHLYLSPIFTATTGSTHGYDVIDPTEIDPALGGREAFTALARAAIDRGMGVILDIVPNHTAFTLENPWLRDVLAHGRDSRYAAHFDIDWSAGPLVLPMLAEPFEKMLADGAFSVSDNHFHVPDLSVPLAPGTPDTTDLRAIHAAQHWRLCHWEIERDGITHRRFFNVTGLIGMRVEDRTVFKDTHALIFDLVREGLVHGLRVDHIDGLADPRTYLDRLAKDLPDTPVWIEKIVVGDEHIPHDWKTVGTTGYEAARLIARVLTDATGLQTLAARWHHATGITQTFPEALARAKRDIMENELAAELHQLVGLARSAARNSALAEPGPESLREVILDLIASLSRYRTYFAQEFLPENDSDRMRAIAEAIAPTLRSRTALDLVLGYFTNPQDSAASAFVTRFQQVSGALLAKAQEDTAGFRWTPFLAANEVGAEPDEATVTAAEADAILAERKRTEMTLTSTHDTKRSEDARMRLVALSHHPDAFAALWALADTLPSRADVEPKWRWYIAQSALAIWHDDPRAIEERLDQHIEKAMREAKQTTFWTRPDVQLEAAAKGFARELCAQWHRERPAELDRLIERGRALALAQLAFKALMPGFPDIYRGAEGEFLALTDPDNRLPVDFGALAALAHGAGFGADKARLTRILLALRRNERAFFDAADARFDATEGHALCRTLDQRTLVAQLSTASVDPGAERLFSARYDGLDLAVFWR